MLVKDFAIVGDIQCLNCGRTLGEAVRAIGERALRIRPAAHQKTVQVSLRERGTLQCNHCRGRAFLEPAFDAEAPIARSTHNSAASLVGAA